MIVNANFTVHGADEDEIMSEVNRTLAEFAPHARHWRIRVDATEQRRADGSVLLWTADVQAHRETTGAATPR